MPCCLPVHLSLPLLQLCQCQCCDIIIHNSEQPSRPSCCIATFPYHTFVQKACAAILFVCWVSAKNIHHYTFDQL
jgi:hypothetical protein